MLLIKSAGSVYDVCPWYKRMVMRRYHSAFIQILLTRYLLNILCPFEQFVHIHRVTRIIKACTVPLSFLNFVCEGTFQVNVSLKAKPMTSEACARVIFMENYFFVRKLKQGNTISRVSTYYMLAFVKKMICWILHIVWRRVKFHLLYIAWQIDNMKRYIKHTLC
jgi:hypothetical protein